VAQNTITINDYSNEKSSFGFSSSELTAGNIVAQLAAAATLVAATEDLTIGEVVKQQIAQVPLDSPATPTSPYAQREMKWLVTYQAVTSGKLHTLEIAAPDITDNVAPNTDIADLSSPDWEAWVTAFVGFAKAPDDLTDSVIVLGARLVGRNI